MNLKRALVFGVMVWIAAFLIIAVLMFTPWFTDSQLRVQATWWILEVPIILLLAKWYFKTVEPTAKNGARLGLIGLLTGVLLDVVITVPVFVKSYSTFFGNELMYVGFIIGWLLCIYAGYEFDATYTKPINIATTTVKEKEEVVE